MRKGQAKRFYVFGVFRIDVTERVLFGHKGPVALTPKAFDLLLFLVENSGHVLDKEELMKQVWPDSFVEENNLAQNISTLRKALGTGGAGFIETIPKRGYRFGAEVTETGEAPDQLLCECPDQKLQPARETDCYTWPDSMVGTLSWMRPSRGAIPKARVLCLKNESSS